MARCRRLACARRTAGRRSRRVWRVHPSTAWVIGGSYADGQFVADTVRDGLPASQSGGRYPQRTIGADAEYSRGHLLLRAELVAARWTLPVLGPRPSTIRSGPRASPSRDAIKIAPGVTAALAAITSVQRPDRHVPDVAVGRAGEPHRSAASRGPRCDTSSCAATVQHNARSRGSMRHATLPAAQVTLWF